MSPRTFHTSLTAFVLATTILVNPSGGVAQPPSSIKLTNRTDQTLTFYDVNENPPPARMPAGEVVMDGTFDIDPAGYNPVFAWDDGIGTGGVDPNGFQLVLELAEVPPLIQYKLFHYQVTPSSEGKDPDLQPTLLANELFTLTQDNVFIVVNRNWNLAIMPDNCPDENNPLQNDLDGDGLGDVCDPCPNVPCDPACPEHSADACIPGGSAAGECSGVDGCCVQTPDYTTTPPLTDAAEICIPPETLPEDETISITQVPITDPEAEVTIGPILERDWGTVIAVYRFDPDGLTFDPPATITLVHEVSDIDSALWNELRIYIRPDPGDTFSAIEGTCSYPVEDPEGSGHFYTTCTAEISSFSDYAVIAPLDTDGDGVPDKFNGVEDNCPAVSNRSQLDYDADGLGDACDRPCIIVCGQALCPWGLAVILLGLGWLRFAGARTPEP